MSSFTRGFIQLALGLIVGLTGANSVADAAGISAQKPSEDMWLRILCGFVLGITTIALTIVASHFASLLIAALRQSSRRPSQTMALALLICGVVCLLMAIAFEWYVVASSHVIRPATAGGPGGSASIQFPSPTGGQQTATISVGGSGEIQIGRAVSPIAHVLALCCFGAGAVLIALGVWSSMSTKPEGYVAPAVVKPSVPA
jgi:hypothetical protein